MFFEERPSDGEMDRLARKFGKAPERIMDWDQRDVEFCREMEKEPCFGEVVLLVLDRDGRLGVVRPRGAPRDAFDLPTGTIREGESVEEAATREGREETGRDIRVERLVAIYRVRVRWGSWDAERWFFVLRCAAMSESATPRDPEEIEAVSWVRLPQETPTAWSREDWWGGPWRRRILEAGGIL